MTEGVRRARAGVSAQKVENVIIIGSGPAGYTAAIYAARAALKPVLVTGLEKGGQLTITTDVENYPGFLKPVQGPWLMDQMAGQAAAVGTVFIEDTVVKLDVSSTPFCLQLDSGAEIRANAIVLATGARARWLGLESEVAYRGSGVSACATCDGFFYRERDVMVVGGGNTAAEEALYLTRFARSVTLVHRRDSLRAEMMLQTRVKENSKISVIWNSELVEVVGEENPKRVTGATLRNVQTAEVTSLPMDGIFIAIGHDPVVDLVKGQVKLKPSGCVDVAPHSTRTSVPGLFAAGDVMDDVFRQAVTAAGNGCMAALEVERYLENQQEL